MSETNTAPVADTDEIKVESITLCDKEFKAKLERRKTRGEDNEYVIVTPEIPLDGLVDFLKSALDGDEGHVFAAAIMRELVRPAAIGASKAAFKTDESGDVTFSDADYQDAFLKEFQAPSRASGVSKKDLVAKLDAINPRFLELTAHVVAAYQNGEEVTTQDALEYKNLFEQVKDLSARIAEKSRGATVGSKRKSKKSKDAAPAAAAS